MKVPNSGVNLKSWCAFIGALWLASAASAGMADKITHGNASGVDVYTYPMGVKDVVTVVGSLPAGEAQAAQSGNVMAATFVGALLDAGTTVRSKDAIRRELNSVGANISFSVDEQALHIQAFMLKKDMPRVVRLLAEELRSPAFSTTEFARVKKQIESRFLERQDDPDDRAFDAFSRALFPAGHPSHPEDTAKRLEDIRRITLDDVKAFYQRYYGPAHMSLVFSGDVQTAAIEKEVGEAFAGWSGGVDYIRSAPTLASIPPRDQSIELKDKSSVSVLWGLRTGMRAGDPDRLALSVATAILGRGFTSRLASNVRVKEGLTYGINADLQGDDYLDGVWVISTSFAPELLNKGIASTRREFDKWWRDGVTQDELDAAKSKLIGGSRIRFTDTFSVNYAVLSILERGMRLSSLDDYAERVRALTLQEVNGAIRKYIDPKKMVLVKVGTMLSDTGAKASRVESSVSNVVPVSPTLKIGDPAPALDPMAWIKGKPISTFEPGRVYVVDFWATWCVPCIHGMPQLSSLQKKYGDRVTIVGVNVRESEGGKADVDHVSAFVKKKGDKMAYTVAMDDPARKTVFNAWMTAAGGYGIPTAFIVDRAGKVVWMGFPVFSKDFHAAIEQALNGTSDLKAARKLQEKMNKETAERTMKSNSTAGQGLATDKRLHLG